MELEQPTPTTTTKKQPQIRCLAFFDNDSQIHTYEISICKQCHWLSNQRLFYYHELGLNAFISPNVRKCVASLGAFQATREQTSLEIDEFYEEQTSSKKK